MAHKKHRRRHKNKKILITFEALPNHALHNLLSYLSLQDVGAVFLTSKRFANAEQDQGYWKQMLEFYFRTTFLAVYRLPRCNVPNYDWFNHFRKTYHALSAALTKHERKIHNLVIEGDLARLLAPDMDFCIAHVKALTHAISTSPNQALRDYCYQTMIAPRYSDKFQVDALNRSIFHWIAILNQPNEIYRRILSGNIFLHNDSYSHSPIDYAIMAGNLAMVKLLVPDSTPIPFHLAVKYHHLDITLSLLEFIVKHQRKPLNGSTYEKALASAAKSSHLEMTLLLLCYKAHVVIKRKYKKTPALYYAVKNNDTDMVELLLNHGANPNISGSITAAAAKNRNLAILTLLIKHGAFVHFVCHGEKALQYAKAHDYPEIILALQLAYLKQLIISIQASQTVYPCGKQMILFPNKKTLSAATALRAVMKNKADKSILAKHHETLQQHDHLRPIYHTLK